MRRVDVLFIGGHHTSSVPVIKKLLDEGRSIVFVGHKHATKNNKELSSEYKEITSLGISYIHLSAAKFYKVSGVAKYFVLLRSFITSLLLLIKFRPKVIVSFGGYLAVPVVAAGWCLRIKIITHEQTVNMGLANRVISRFANKILLTWDNDKLDNKTFVVGIPLRNEILNVPVKNLDDHYNLKTLFVQGGKQGSHTINEFVFNNIEYLTNEFIVFHQTSANSQNDDVKKSLELKNQFKNKYYPFEFLYGIDYSNILEKSDFAISRSGAHIVYEFSYLKLPSIFIPISWSSGNEQEKNANLSVEYIPSIVLDENNLSLNTLEKAIKDLNAQIKKNLGYKKVATDAVEKILEHINYFLK